MAGAESHSVLSTGVSCIRDRGGRECGSKVGGETRVDKEPREKDETEIEVKEEEDETGRIEMGIREGV
jgi:hypothetical protein